VLLNLPKINHSEGIGTSLLLIPIFVAYARRKELICTNNKLVYYPKNTPALSPLRTQSALRFGGFLGVVRGHSSARWESCIKGEK
jgi:hypothetical protein